MSVCWMFMILLGCRLSHASQSESTSTCNHKLETRCVPVRGNVTVPCPKLTGEDVRLTLLKDEKVFYIEKHASNNVSNTSVGVALVENNGSVNFTLIEVNASSHGIYRCDGEIMYPPPYLKESSPVRKLVLVEGHQCNFSSPETGEHQVLGLHWIWISVIVVLCIYSIVVTIVAIVNWIKLRHSDSQSDYMNTKPRAPKDRKRKRFLNPIPRHF